MTDRSQRWLLLLSTIVLLVPVLYTTLALPAPVWDEALHHLPVARSFGPGLPGIELLRSYNSAVGPAFYILAGNIGAATGYSIITLRLFVFFCAALNAVLFFLIARRLAPGRGPTALLLFVTYPYFFTLSGTFMSEQPALTFGLLALLLFTSTGPGRAARLVLSGIAAGVAILTRQFFVFLPVGLALGECGMRTGRRRWIGLLLLLAPLLVITALLLLWRGLAPPGFQERHHPGFTLTGLSSVLIWTGLFFLPWLLLRLRRAPRSPWLLVALLAIPVTMLAPEPGAGITRALLALLPEPLMRIAVAVLGTAGAAWFVETVLGLKGSSPPRAAVALSAIALAAMFALGGPLVYERYYLLLYPLLLLAAIPTLDAKRSEAPPQRGDVKRSGTSPQRGELRVALAWSVAVQLPLAIVHLLRLSGR
jgi:4-amino-4-deoxy-L-arabinose transferase-like glycosyltransferase